MLYKTKAISLNYIKYRDTSVIARIYTEQFGLQSYIINSIRIKKSKFKMALLQPFTLLELVCYHNNKKDIQRIAEMKHADLVHNIPFDIRKSSIALFLTEVLVKTLREEHADHGQFDFLYHSVQALDNAGKEVNHFHLQFLLKFGKYLGIVPDSAAALIDEISHHHKLNVSENEYQLQLLLTKDYEDNITLTKNEKQHCFDVIMKFYTLHFANLGELKSLNVLTEVLK